MADKVIDGTRSFFPQAGLAQDGWSTKEEATATCYCGTVQLSFVSSPRFLKDARISSLPASIQTRLRFRLCLPLQRLPQNHGFDVYLRFRHPRHALKSCSWGRKSQAIQPITNNRAKGERHDQLLLQYVWVIDVPKGCGIPRGEFTQDRHSR